MRRIIAVLVSVLVLTGCTLPSVHHTVPSMDSCADKFMRVVAGWPSPGAFDCATPAYQKFLEGKGKGSDAKLVNPMAPPTIKVGICDMGLLPLDKTTTGKGYEVSGFPDGSSALIVVVLDNKTHRVEDVTSDNTVTCQSSKDLTHV